MCYQVSVVFFFKDVGRKQFSQHGINLLQNLCQMDVRIEGGQLHLQYETIYLIYNQHGSDIFQECLLQRNSGLWADTFHCIDLQKINHISEIIHKIDAIDCIRRYSYRHYTKSHVSSYEIERLMSELETRQSIRHYSHNCDALEERDHDGHITWLTDDCWNLNIGWHPR